MLTLGIASALAFGALGCGGSSQPSTRSGASNVPRSVVPPRAASFANAVNLVASDAAGMSLITPATQSTQPMPANEELAHCSGGVVPDQLAVFRSATFGTAGRRETVRSAVEVLPTAAIAARNNRAARSPLGRACLVRFLDQGQDAPTGEGASHGRVSVTPIANPLVGAEGAFGLRLTTTASGARRGAAPARLYTDESGFAGAAEINLTATGVSKPVPSSTELRLLALLDQRADAHKP